MSGPKSYSQAGQDLWVIDRLNGKVGGSYLDCGANHPTLLSNTYLLESQYGWKGFLLDNDAFCLDLLRKERKSTVIDCDTTKFDYASLPIRDFDYVSLDVDAASLDSLRKMLADGVTFRVMTAEDDRYRFGNAPMEAMKELLLARGYIIAKEGVCNPQTPDMPFENWYVDPKRV